MTLRKSKPIYKSGIPYTDFGLNWLAWGCTHGCDYCYACRMRKKTKDDWMAQIELVDNIVPLLTTQLELHQARNLPWKGRVMAPTMHDPFMDRAEVIRLSLTIYDMLNRYKVPYRVLTKSPRIVSYLNRFIDQDALVGLTITTQDPSVFKDRHPGCWFTPRDQIQALQNMHYYGNIKTWISFEPLLSKWVVETVMDQLNFAPTEVMIGKMNYYEDPLALEDHWHVWQVAKRLNAKGIKVVPKPEWLRLLMKHPQWDNNDLDKFSCHPETLLVPTT